ncbi:hypothetical protein GGI07_003735 [Coemansia sp. Benny D115]|nr:hypothetical protein GGI07_003735 [Coemansia sp. Benny D115]
MLARFSRRAVLAGLSFTRAQPLCMRTASAYEPSVRRAFTSHQRLATNVTSTPPEEHSQGTVSTPQRPAVPAEVDPIDKVDLRVGIVEAVERHGDADSLYVLTVNLGEKTKGPRTIVSGLVKYYSAEQLCGKKIVVLANMKPRKLRGVQSQGMLLAASHGTGAETESGNGSGSLSVEVLEAGEAAQAGDPVQLQDAERTAKWRSIVKKQRLIQDFIDGLELNACVAKYRGKMLTVAGDAVRTREMQSGVIG